MVFPTHSVLQPRKVVMPLIGITVFMFVLQNVLGPSFTQSLVLDSSLVLLKPWTLITSMFLHANFSHILFNMYALLMFGPLIEQRIGAKRFLYMYFGSGIAAGLGFVFFKEFLIGSSASALGASGAIMGVLGMTIIMLPQMRILFFFIFPMSMRTAGIVFALINVFGLFGVGGSGIANSAHLAGLAVGLIYARYLMKEKKNFYKEFARPYRDRSTKKDYNKTVELSEQDVEEYLKKGRL